MDRFKKRSLIPSLLNEINELQDFLAFDNHLKFDNSNSISLYENENNVFVEAALPGMEIKDIEINVDRDILWIKGECKKEEKEDKDIKYHLKSCKNYFYKISLPSNICDTASPKASYKNGILKIIFDKIKTSKPQKIEISEEEK